MVPHPGDAESQARPSPAPPGAGPGGPGLVTYPDWSWRVGVGWLVCVVACVHPDVHASNILFWFGIVWFVQSSSCLMRMPWLPCRDKAAGLLASLYCTCCPAHPPAVAMPPQCRRVRKRLPAPTTSEALDCLRVCVASRPRSLSIWFRVRVTMI